MGGRSNYGTIKDCSVEIRNIMATLLAKFNEEIKQQVFDKPEGCNLGVVHDG